MADIVKCTPGQALESQGESSCVHLEAPTSVRAFMRNAVKNAPCRPLNNRRGNVTLKYASRNNDRVLELENRFGE